MWKITEANVIRVIYIVGSAIKVVICIPYRVSVQYLVSSGVEPLILRELRLYPFIFRDGDFKSHP